MADRLSRLDANRILNAGDAKTWPERHEYRLTGMGRDRYAVTVAIMCWGDRWLDDQFQGVGAARRAPVMSGGCPGSAR
ncbi:winged helix-turn-helix transcriptional regulator [Pseudonocardia sp. GCM10023141]|uniref:winged helix-turn-helix transcriptional regulator n=1 Tax=Pseudonocardia sp. GCM10023141 TaxID=3252653 RepID=UPI003621CA74